MSNLILPTPVILFAYADRGQARAIAFRLDLSGFSVEALPAKEGMQPARSAYDAAIVQLQSADERGALTKAQAVARRIIVLAGSPPPAAGNGVDVWLTAPFSPRQIEDRLRQLVEAPGLHCSVPIIRAAHEYDWPEIWQLFQEVAAAGDAYAYDEHTPEEIARKLWFEEPAQPFVIDFEGRFAGSYYVRPNQPGRGDHVANAGYMIAAHAQGQGFASLLCAHSLDTARAQGFRAVQFNFVVSTNAGALHVWQKFGFAVVGRVPRAYRHAKLGLVDVLILHREL